MPLELFGLMQTLGPPPVLRRLDFLAYWTTPTVRTVKVDRPRTTCRFASRLCESISTKADLNSRLRWSSPYLFQSVLRNIANENSSTVSTISASTLEVQRYPRDRSASSHNRDGK
jgi:hypothetical protein